LRKSGPDYLAYALIDAVVDHYFLILEKISEKIEQFEERIHAEPTSEILKSIHDLRREIIYFRKQVSPLREVLNSWKKAESTLIQESNNVYIRHQSKIRQVAKYGRFAYARCNRAAVYQDIFVV
jgi:magnesium transporter